MSYVLMFKFAIASVLSKLSTCLDMFDNLIGSDKNNGNFTTSSNGYVSRVSMYDGDSEDFVSTCDGRVPIVSIHTFNPANGYPMAGDGSGVDVGGNPYGSSEL